MGRPPNTSPSWGTGHGHHSNNHHSNRQHNSHIFPPAAVNHRDYDDPDINTRTLCDRAPQERKIPTETSSPSCLVLLWSDLQLILNISHQIFPKPNYAYCMSASVLSAELGSN